MSRAKKIVDAPLPAAREPIPWNVLQISTNPEDHSLWMCAAYFSDDQLESLLTLTLNALHERDLLGVRFVGEDAGIIQNVVIEHAQAVIDAAKAEQRLFPYSKDLPLCGAENEGRCAPDDGDPCCGAMESDKQNVAWESEAWSAGPECAIAKAPQRHVVALTGPAGCGKDTVADLLVREHGYTRLAFADPLRAMALDLNPMVTKHGWLLADVVEVHGWDFAKRTFPEVRRMLQRLGTEVGRKHVRDDFWISKAADVLWSSPETKWVITDCRFENEAEMSRSMGGVVCHIERPGLEPLPGAHASEAGVKVNEDDWVLENDGDLDDLREQAEQIASLMDER